MMFNNLRPFFHKKFLYMVLLTLFISGCAKHYSGGATHEDPYGIFSGWWHGFIFPISLCINVLSWVLGLIDISLFRNIEIIGQPNTGFFYYVGFIFGFFSSCGTAAQS